ncbi:DUF1707 SHOCT-like domain-containing protein [Micropruina sp.]|uniref:DUF1707 SHOCT-like domain-containing protein n=1 Tax=Micropruina sp. TaxID=2737536 RepID=UPI0039E44FC1
MDNLPISSKYRSRPLEPLGDAEREQLAERLNDEFARGGIDTDAYRAMLDQVFAANTLGEVASVVASLPAKDTFAVPVVIETGTAAPGELLPARTTGLRAPLLLVAGLGTGIAVAILLVVLIIL